MQILRLPPRHHLKAEIVCPPLPWGTVGRATLKTGALALVTGALLVLFALTNTWRQRPAAALGAVCILGVFVASVLCCAHFARAAREPVRFQVARGELSVTWPFLFTRRTRVVPTADVTGIVVSAPSAGGRRSRPAGRLAIRRRHRRPLRIPGRRPLAELNRTAEELRAVLHV